MVYLKHSNKLINRGDNLTKISFFFYWNRIQAALPLYLSLWQDTFSWFFEAILPNVCCCWQYFLIYGVMKTEIQNPPCKTPTVKKKVRQQNETRVLNVAWGLYSWNVFKLVHFQLDNAPVAYLNKTFQKLVIQNNCLNLLWLKKYGDIGYSCHFHLWCFALSTHIE